jgi:anaerobic magnesium-protoporphyrin IX monomethyl ester cyclase
LKQKNKEIDIMPEIIDCLLIGHNETDINAVSAGTSSVYGRDSAIYRELNYQFVEHGDRKFTFSDLYNHIKRSKRSDFSQADHVHMGSVFCLSIAALGSFLHRHHLSFDYINSFNLEQDKLKDLLQSKQIRTIGITTTFYSHYTPIREIVEFIKEYNDSTPIVVGGPFVGNKLKENPRTALIYFNKIGANIYIDSSQGEATLVNIIRCLKERGSLAEVANIFYKENGKFSGTALRPENNDLEYNTVDWGLFKENLPQLACVRSAISCPFQCSFCGFPERAGKHYSISVAALEKELLTLSDTNVKSIFFTDDTFNVPLSRFKEILRMMIRNRFSFKWSSYFRCQFADRETLDLMAEAGCEGVNLGLESGNQQILDNMNKKVTVELYRQGLQLLNEYDFLKLGTFIIGFPGETASTVEDTASFIEESRLSYCNYLLWFCDPITPIYRERERYNLTGSDFNWSHATMDSNTALDLLEQQFASIRNTTWLSAGTLGNLLPFVLHHQEQMSFGRIENLIKDFSAGIAAKMANQDQTADTLSPELWGRLNAAVLDRA